MQLNLKQGFGNRNTSASELTGFPLEIKSGSSMVAGIFMLGFSLFWNGILFTMISAGLGQGEMTKAGFLFLIPFALAGIGVFIMALYFLTVRQQILITETDVHYDKKSLFGKKEWYEALTAYRGVLHRTERRSSGSSSSGGSRSSTTYYLVELIHPERSKTIKLWESRSKQGHRSEWEGYAKFLNIPAIEKDGDDYIERQAEDLDKSVTDLMKEGKVEIDHAALDSRPDGINVSRIDDFTAITFEKSKTKGGWIGLLVVLLFASVFIWLGFWVEDASVIFGLVGILFILAMIGGLIWSKIATRQIRINRAELNFLWLTQWGNWTDAHFPVNEIESVIVKKENSTATLIIESDAKTKKFGFGVEEKTLNWLRNQILSIISD